ncbi:MAG: pentapeptide repeat-containing protein [Winogradskyella sp.]|uniref:pentapeptide repeat-containing protein n=1 Tax=Winogradskyella sp. TaxID=1883156 RepID=UPI0017BE3455|nr:pentapeptide repeat-containing protein [Winogradskyella sp.]
MCNHKYKINSFKAPKACYLEELVSEYQDELKFELPVDDQGMCLFHSEDSQWKIENQFDEKLNKLFSFMVGNKGIKEVDFRGFYFVSNNEKGIQWSDLTLTKPLNLGGAKFECEFHLTNSHFADDVYMDEVELHKIFNVEHCEFTSSFTSIGGSIFHSTVYMSDVNFTDLFDIKHAQFLGQVSLAPVIFQGYTVFDDAVFKASRTGFNYFVITAKDYTTFKDTVFHDPVQFEKCQFIGDTHFDKTVFKRQLHFEQPTISGNVFFKGESDDFKIFGNEVNMEIGLSSFEKSGQIIFENANLLNLDSTTKQKLTQLKAHRRIEIGSGTIVFRVSFEQIYKDEDLTELFLRDLLSTIRDYFDKKLNKHFEFVFRKEEDDIIVSFFTDEFANVSDFEKSYEETKDEISDRKKTVEEVVLKYLKDKFDTDLERILKTAVKEKLNAAFLKNLLKEDILKVYLEGAQIDSLHAGTLYIDEVKDSTFYVAKLDGLTNQPDFSLSEEQFESLKSDFAKLNDSQWQEVEKLLKKVIDNQVKPDQLIPFLTERGVRITDGLSAGIILIFLKHLIMM